MMISKICQSILIMTIAVCWYSSDALSQSQSTKLRHTPPRFEDFPASKSYQGKSVPVKLSGSSARMYRTRLREAAKEKPNFAGHYIFTTWGCGTECMSTAIIDARTGNVYFMGSINWPPTIDADQALQFRLHSALIVITGVIEDERGPQPYGTYYYRWENNRPVLIYSVKLPEPN